MLRETDMDTLDARLDIVSEVTAGFGAGVGCRVCVCISLWKTSRAASMDLLRNQ